MVAVKDENADRYLASPPDGMRLFLLYGSDAGAVTERARAVERVALERGGGDQVQRFGSDLISSDPGRVAEEACSASLFGGEPVVSLRVLDGRHNVLAALGPLLKVPPDQSWVIVEAGELPPTSALRKAFEECPNAVAVPAFHLEGKSLISFIIAAAEMANVSIEPEAVELLSELLGGDRQGNRRELEKLFLYAGEGSPISVADVCAIVGETAEARSDDLIDAALRGDLEELETGFIRLKAEGGSFAGLAAQALRHLLQLQTLRAAIERGSSMSSAMALARPPVFWRRKTAVEAQLTRWSSARLRIARSTLAQAVLTSRMQSGLEEAAIAAALQDMALTARRMQDH